ncbi:MAG: flagellar type III secretion system pore protein FliP [Deltaproteobacteria bacterium]|nr:flagellar type III secretion system pore protein FliP [Deltaproteobacteria bacterium]
MIRGDALALLALGLVGTLTLAGPTRAQPLPLTPAGPTQTAPTGPTTPGGPSGPAAPELTAPGAATTPGAAPFLRIDVGGESASGLAPALKVALLLVALTFVPAVLLAMTSFTRIIVVLGLVRQGIGVAQLPPTRVLTALALFLTAFTMAPVFSDIYQQAYLPWEAGQLTDGAALDAALGPLRDFMLSHTREADLMMFVDLAGGPVPQVAADVPTTTLVPAFILSELKTAFQMGALLFLPFLVIELVVGSVLMSMGMMMLPPATISLPLKILVFVAVDGWGLVIGSLAQSIRS